MGLGIYLSLSSNLSLYLSLSHAISLSLRYYSANVKIFDDVPIPEAKTNAVVNVSQQSGISLSLSSISLSLSSP